MQIGGRCVQIVLTTGCTGFTEGGHRAKAQQVSLRISSIKDVGRQIEFLDHILPRIGENKGLFPVRFDRIRFLCFRIIVIGVQAFPCHILDAVATKSLCDLSQFEWFRLVVIQEGLSPCPALSQFQYIA